ncbi:hypothetical protein BRE01_41140 [Brevibacillus reuszeri]|uniref:Uncharacterized protein n=1 Tax=Brevibacillus reuszeri TaxID=54915 RepID=A0ABQ0TRA9_9BACL|nr:hypothetical protein BRE01_41140 [Brevibacillus reuszeri]
MIAKYGGKWGKAVKGVSWHAYGCYGRRFFAPSSWTDLYDEAR